MTFPPKSALIACEITYLRIQKTSKQQKCENRAESYAIASENFALASMALFFTYRSDCNKEFLTLEIHRTIQFLVCGVEITVQLEGSWGFADLR